MKHLDDTHIPIIENMVEIGLSLLEGQGGTKDDVRTGFHWPPFTSVNHLHLHVISPTSSLGFFSRNVMYKPDSWAFATSEWAVNYLKGKPHVNS